MLEDRYSVAVPVLVVDFVVTIEVPFVILNMLVVYNVFKEIL